MGSTAYGHGAALMVRKEAIRAAGPMDTSYFLYYEELDWCERIRKEGYSIAVQQNGLVVHKASASVGKQSPLKIFYQNRNRVRFLKKHYPAWSFFAFCTYMFSIVGMKETLRFFFKTPKNVKAFWKGIFQATFVKNPPVGIPNWI